MQLVLSWPIRLLIIALLAFSIAVDGAGYIYRLSNGYPLTGNVPNLPPNYFGWQLYIHKGLDLAGGTHIDYQLTNFPAGQNRADVQQRTVDVINKRVNALGVSEPEIRGAGSQNDRITVDLAGVTADQAQQAIGRITKLVYAKWVPDSKVTNGPEPGYKPQLVGLTGDDIQSASAGLDQNGVYWVVNLTFTSHGADVFSKLTQDNVNACPGDPTTDTTGASSCAQRHLSIWLDLTQSDIDNWENADYVNTVSRPWDSPQNATDPTPKFLTDPITIQQISGGQATISGTFSQQSANNLATGINSGSLPVTLVVLDVTQVGSTLGEQSVTLSVAAGLLGLSIVVIFMIVYYRVPGLLASLALLFYAGAVFAVFKALPVTLTLAGITGFILSVGMAVDANVLIFERIKEELWNGKTMRAAVRVGFQRAFSAVFDSHFTTIVGAGVLYMLGTGTVKGFAFTLFWGTVVSLFTAVFITRFFVDVLVDNEILTTPELYGVKRSDVGIFAKGAAAEARA